MGFFGGKEIMVASTVYNMAGDVIERPDYLKTLVAGNVISNSRFSMTDTLRSGYMNGQGIKLRRLHRWALANYGQIGVPSVSILNSKDFDRDQVQTALEELLPPPAGWAYQVTDVDFGGANAGYWAEKYILENFPERIDTNWTVDRRPGTSSATITWADLTTTSIAVPANFGEDVYLYITYQLSKLTAPYTVTSRMYAYLMGSGANATMENLREVTVPTGSFLPFIPVRIDEEFLSDLHLPTVNNLAKKAYKRLTGQKLSKLIDKLNENEDVGDIDHAFIVQGVALNAFENEGRKYLFRFFDKMRTAHPVPATRYSDWRDGNLQGYKVYRVEYRGAYDSYTHDSDAQYVYINENEAPFYPNKPITSLRIRANGSAISTVAKLDFEIKWASISKTTGAGLAKPDAVVGDVWWNVGATLDNGSGQINIGRIVYYSKKDDTQVQLIHQKSATEWEAINIIGLEHHNNVYSNKSIEITAQEALMDPEESGFIVPLHYETFREMSLVESTQLSLCSSYLVLNSYQVVKQKWYQTSFFKVILVIVVIAITVATMGTGAGAGAGVLGSAMAVGTALGFTGLMAAIVGAVANAIAAMLITQIIGKVATAVFGEKIGMIIAAVASVIAMNVGSTLASGGSMAAMWGNMMSATNIISMTSAVGNGIQGYMAASAAEYGQKTEQLMEDFQKQSKQYTDMYLKEFGQGKFDFDPTKLTNTILSGNYPETEAQFLARTMLTGSDIADMTLDMLTNFADMTLNLDTSGS